METRYKAILENRVTDDLFKSNLKEIAKSGGLLD